MAIKPGPLTEWPWERLGSFKYLLFAPMAVEGACRLATKGWSGAELPYDLVLPSLLLRMVHNQVWITLSRYVGARRLRIVDRSIEFDQVDRERNWDDQIIFNGLLFYLFVALLPCVKLMPLWSTEGFIWTVLLHAGPVEFLYYWFHRALHHHFLYTRYHSHHHSSIATEPITSVIHPFGEHIVYYLLFSIPMLTTLYMGKSSVASVILYIAYLDFMNNMGHCNFEVVPKWMFQVLPPLKYLMYTPSFHSLHHTQFRTNYSLFMPFYDYIYKTMDKASDELYEDSLEVKKDDPDIVHLTHLTTLQSVFHLRIGIASIASKPYESSTWYMLMLWPITCFSMILSWMFGSSSVTVENIKLPTLKMQTWAVPRYNFHYRLNWQKQPINSLIDKAIVEADKRGVKVVSLGLYNQAKDLNNGGQLFVQKYPKLRVRLVDGSSLATAVVLKSIPPGTRHVALCGNLSKVARATAINLCKMGVKVTIRSRDNYSELRELLQEESAKYLACTNDTPQVWLVDNICDAEQWKAPKGTKFIPTSQFPPKKIRKDCTYYMTPAMKVPATMQNVHSCENWLPRRVMSAWRIAGIVHALEGWDTHECGDTMTNIRKIWEAAIAQGFSPIGQV